MLIKHRFRTPPPRLHHANHEVLGWTRSSVGLLLFPSFFSFFSSDWTPCRKEQKRSHTLRYVLKNRATDEVLFVVLFSLYLKEDVDEEGNIKEGVVESANLPFELRYVCPFRVWFLNSGFWMEFGILRGGRKGFRGREQDLIQNRDKENVKKHGKQKGGSWWWGGGDGTADEEEDKVVEESKETKPEKPEEKKETVNPDDDVD